MENEKSSFELSSAVIFIETAWSRLTDKTKHTEASQFKCVHIRFYVCMNFHINLILSKIERERERKRNYFIVIRFVTDTYDAFTNVMYCAW